MSWKIKRRRGWGACSLRKRWWRRSFWGGHTCAKSCYFYCNKFEGITVIFEAMQFNEAFFQRSWRLIWRTFWRVRTLVWVTFWENDPALSGLVPSFASSWFSCGRNRRRDEVAAGLLAEVQSRPGLSLLSSWLRALPLNPASWCYVCPVVLKMHEPICLFLLFLPLPEETEPKKIIAETDVKECAAFFF